MTRTVGFLRVGRSSLNNDGRTVRGSQESDRTAMTITILSGSLLWFMQGRDHQAVGLDGRWDACFKLGSGRFRWLLMPDACIIV